jgi:MFS family permease
MNHALRAFRHRNFRLFYAGQAISLIGTWIQQIALSWLVYRTTGSGFLLGLVAFCSQIPMLIFVPLAGLLSDRYDRRKLMIAAYALAAVQALTLGLLALTGTIRVGQILVLGFLYGVIMAFETPARQSLISQMVDSRDDLPNAIALNSVLMNSGRLIGPSIAGLLLVFVSEGWCFLINAASFIAIIVSAIMMRLPPKKAAVAHRSLLHDLGVAARYAWQMRPNVFELSRLVPFTSAAAGIALVLVGVSKNYWLSLAFMACLGFGIIVTAASVNMMLQTIVDDDKRGRIISFYAMAFLGMAPVGGLIAGSLAGELGAPVTAMVEGTCCLLGALWLMRGFTALRPDLRRAFSQR